MSVYKRGKRWRAVLTDPTDATKRISQSFATKVEAEQWLAEIRTDARRGDYLAPSETTVADLVRRWLEEQETLGRLAPSSVGLYGSDVRLYVLPTLGDVKLTDLTVGDIKRRMLLPMLNGTLRDRKLSEATVRGAVVPLASALDDAVDDGLLRGNPAKAIRWKKILPKDTEPQPPKPTFSERELHRLIESAPDEEAAAFLGVICGHGLRISEALGLRRRDLGQRSVAVDQQAKRDASGVTRRLKTKKSRRVVRTLDGFEGHLSDARRLAAGSDEDALVWRRLDGRPLPQQTTARRWLYPAEQEAGLPRAGWHQLRHSFAGVLRDRGVELVEARDLLGHESIKTTADVYQRLDLETQRARAEAL